MESRARIVERPSPRWMQKEASRKPTGSKDRQAQDGLCNNALDQSCSFQQDDCQASKCSDLWRILEATNGCYSQAIPLNTTSMTSAMELTWCLGEELNSTIYITNLHNGTVQKVTDHVIMSKKCLHNFTHACFLK